MLSTILLHDVCEDCNLRILDLPFNDRVQHIVKLMTLKVLDSETKETATARYDYLIQQNSDGREADRQSQHSFHHGRSIFQKKTMACIEEIRQYVLPLFRSAENAARRNGRICLHSRTTG